MGVADIVGYADICVLACLSADWHLGVCTLWGENLCKRQFGIPEFTTQFNPRDTK